MLKSAIIIQDLKRVTLKSCKSKYHYSSCPIFRLLLEKSPFMSRFQVCLNELYITSCFPICLNLVSDKFQSGLRKNQSPETTPHYIIRYIILTVSLYLKKSSHSLTPLPGMSFGTLQLRLRHCEWLHSSLSTPSHLLTSHHVPNREFSSIISNLSNLS